MDYNTFLNTNTLDGELYGLLQSISIAQEISKKNENGVYYNSYETIVKKSLIPKQADMCEKLNIKSPKTLRTHLKSLKDQGYLVERDNGDYYLPVKEDIYLDIPLSTLEYLQDNCREHIIKIYIYLVQKYKYKQSLNTNEKYIFTLNEIAEHIGIYIKNNQRAYDIINHALELLYNSGLIDYETVYVNKIPKKKLLNVSLVYSNKKK